MIHRAKLKQVLGSILQFQRLRGRWQEIFRSREGRLIGGSRYSVLLLCSLATRRLFSKVWKCILLATDHMPLLDGSVGCIGALGLSQEVHALSRV